MQGFLDESGLFIFYLFLFVLYAEIHDGPPKVAGKIFFFLQKVASRLCRYHAGQKFR